MTNPKTWKVYRVALSTGEVEEVPSYADTFTIEAVACNLLNKNWQTYGTFYYCVDSISPK